LQREYVGGSRYEARTIAAFSGENQLDITVVHVPYPHHVISDDVRTRLWWATRNLVTAEKVGEISLHGCCLLEIEAATAFITAVIATTTTLLPLLSISHDKGCAVSGILSSTPQV